jgi:hypothetical protein
MLHIQKGGVASLTRSKNNYLRLRSILLIAAIKLHTYLQAALDREARLVCDNAVLT